MISIQLDKTTGVTYINHQRGTRSLLGTRKVDPVLGRTPHSSLVHCLHSDHRKLKGRLPKPAASGPKSVFNQYQRWGILKVGLLTSRFNNKLDRLVLSYRDPLVETVNVLVTL